MQGLFSPDELVSENIKVIFSQCIYFVISLIFVELFLLIFQIFSLYRNGNKKLHFFRKQLISLVSCFAYISIGCLHFRRK